MCRHCYMDAGNIKEDDKTILETAKKIVCKLKKYGVQRIMLTGGECTISSNLIELLQFIKKKNITPMIFTNGFNFNEKILEYVDNYCLSIDGDKEYHNYLRQNERAYDNVVKTIKLLKLNNKNVKVQMTISHDSIEYISVVARTVYDLGVRQLNIGFMLNKGRYNNNHNVPIEKLNKLVEDTSRSLGYNIVIHTDVFNRFEMNSIARRKGLTFPLWIDLVNNNCYYVDEKYGFPLNELSKTAITKMNTNINNSIHKIKQKKFIVLEEELMNGGC